MTYSLPEHLREQVKVGSYVSVPLGRQTVPGFVIRLTEIAPGFRTRPITEKLTDEDPLRPQDVDLALWMADRYRCSLADALRCFLPPGGVRKAVRTVELTDAGRHSSADLAVSSAPNQKVILEELRQRGSATAWQLGQVFGGGRAGAAKAGAALQGLIGKGLAVERRKVSRPTAAPKTRQTAQLVGDGTTDWEAVAAGLEPRAPKQAEVIRALMQAGGPMPVAELPRQAVNTLRAAGLVSVEDSRVERSPDAQTIGDESGLFLDLNPAQGAAVDRVREALARGAHEAVLVFGVTGSGKTEVYLHSIRLALEAGRGAIVLVPEIALTPQAVGRFRARFGNRLAVLHSSLGPGERYDEWDRIQRGEADIVIGARSAIFAPCRNVGVIVVDEEHERAYKQDSEPRYAAQLVAAERARRENAVLIVGSATPSIETYFAAKAEHGGLSLAELPERVDSRPLPPVQIVDLRKEPVDGQGGTFSQVLLQALQECVDNGEQAMLFLNRRGFSTFIMCRECGHSLRCPDCAVALIYHHGTRRACCHHCGYERPVPDQCENCQGYDIGYRGLGTERVADQVERQISGAVVARMDRDTTAKKGAYGDILRRFARGEANILVGTQMIAKGHDFPNVTLVGVLNADTGLNRPDFRASEQTFQLLTQVSGRAGRADRPGRVIVQTYNPEHPAIAAASRHDYSEFYHRELASRRENGYPPFSSLARIAFADSDAEQVARVAARAAAALEQSGVARGRGEVHYLGPVEAPLHKLRGQFRFHMLIKGPDPARIRRALDGLFEMLGDVGETRITVDIDPQDMM